MDPIRIKLSENVFIEVPVHVPETGNEAETKKLREKNKHIIRWLLDTKLMTKAQIAKVFGLEDQWDE